MTAASTVGVWLDHDFPHEPTVTPPGLMHVGTVLDVDVFCTTDLDTEPHAVSDGATADLDPTPPRNAQPMGSGSPALAIDQRKAQLIEELVDVLLTKPSQFYSYLIGELRRNHVATLTDLPVEVLYSVVSRALQLHGARGGK